MHSISALPSKTPSALPVSQVNSNSKIDILSAIDSSFSLLPSKETIYDWGGGAVVGLLLTVIISSSAQVLRRISQRSILQVMTGFQSDNLPVAIIGTPMWAIPGTTELTKSTYALPLIGYGPLVSYAQIASRLSRGGSKMPKLPEILLGSHYWSQPEDKKRDHDILLFGFPAGNSATAQLEPMFNLPFQFRTNGSREIISTQEQKQLASAKYSVLPDNSHKAAVRDAGIIARMIHPLNSKRKILYIAGCETFGVKIACEGLNIAQLPRILGLDSVLKLLFRLRVVPTLWIPKPFRVEFAAIFEANVVGLSTGEPSLAFAWVRKQPGDEWICTWPGKV